MSNRSYYSQAFHGPFETFDLGHIDLESGYRLRGAKIAYRTIGSLSAAKDNAILFPTWYSGTSGIIEQAYVGSGRALDPGKYFIIIANQIGNIHIWRGEFFEESSRPVHPRYRGFVA